MSRLGQPRSDLIDLMTSKVGGMVARRIDEAHGWPDVTPELRTHVRNFVERTATTIRTMTRDQLEDCHVELNKFFRLVPFSEAIPVAIEIEKKWPHHIELLPEANRRLDLIRKGGEYALLFSEEKIKNMLTCVAEIEGKQ